MQNRMIRRIANARTALIMTVQIITLGMDLVGSRVSSLMCAAPSKPAVVLRATPYR